jgi:hypothetical protein
MANVLGTVEETMGLSSLQERLGETFKETLRVRADLLADRISVKEGNRRASELERRTKGLEQELKSAGG